MAQYQAQYLRQPDGLGRVGGEVLARTSTISPRIAVLSKSSDAPAANSLPTAVPVPQ